MAGSKKVIFLSSALLVLLVGGLIGWNIFKQNLISKIFANLPAPEVTISTVVAKAQPWHPYIESVGELRAVNGVQVSAQASGHVIKLLAAAGQIVQKGQPIIQIDDRLEQKMLKKQLALLKLADLTYQRRFKLRKSSAVSQAEVDEAKAHLDEAKATVDHVKVEIDHKRIAAPFKGQLGLMQVDIGDYITPGMPLVSLQSNEPLEVHLSVPEKDAGHIAIGQRMAVHIPHHPNAFEAKVIGFDAKMDASTHTLPVKAALTDIDPLLRPGMFVTVKLALPVQKKVIVLPQTAVVFNPYGDAVYVVDKEQVVKRRYVTLGERQGGVVVVKQGLEAGERVVSSGQLKLRDGMTVQVNNENTQNIHEVH